MTHLLKPRKDGDNKPKLRTLHLSVKGVYFQQIAAGEKVEEFRLMTPHWSQRLEGQVYDQIEIAWGYPAKEDLTKRMRFKWHGFLRNVKLTHPHFGTEPVQVFAIDISERIL